MSAVSLWITVIAVVVVIAYLVAPQSQAPNLISGDQPQTFDNPHYIISWAPNPIVQHSYGQHTLAPDDMRHVIPKQLLGYSYDALNQQEIVDAAALKVRKAMYGR